MAVKAKKPSLPTANPVTAAGNEPVPYASSRSQLAKRPALKKPPPTVAKPKDRKEAAGLAASKLTGKISKAPVNGKATQESRRVTAGEVARRAVGAVGKVAGAVGRGVSGAVNAIRNYGNRKANQAAATEARAKKVRSQATNALYHQNQRTSSGQGSVRTSNIPIARAKKSFSIDQDRAEAFVKKLSGFGG